MPKSKKQAQSNGGKLFNLMQLNQHC